MLLVAVAWIYVVGLMAATQPTFIAGFFTFIFYCVVPLSILFYLTGGRRRRAKRQRIAAMEARSTSGSASGSLTGKNDNSPDNTSDSDGGDGGGD
jgi:hypothetical protein